MEDSMPHYPPTVNDPEAFKFAMDVAGRCGGVLQAQLLAAVHALRAQLLFLVGAG